jgi:hypothetical protein
MEPVSLERYEKFVAGVESGELKPGAQPLKLDLGDNAMTMAMSPYGGGSKSKMSQMAETEFFNLAIGLYEGFMEAYNRVKPLPRTPAKVDFVAMVQSARANTAGQAVDYFCRRFLSVELQAPRRKAIVEFLSKELGTHRVDNSNPKLPEALRQTVHLVLSAPEYQMN